MNNNVIAVIDGAAGSCGKAKVMGEIATSGINLIASVTNCMPNAGHTFVFENGQKYVFRNIPVAVVNPQTELFIGPDSIIDMDAFIEEYNAIEKLLGNRKIYVHELVPIIEKRHVEKEKQEIKSGSTNKGSGACRSEKILRNPNLNFFKGYKNAIVLSNDEWLEKLYKHLDNSNGYVMLEGAQGCDLSLNFSGNHPFVTSRNVSVSSMLDGAGISPKRLKEALMVIRPFPIRINNITKDGKYIYTGNYGNGCEFYWSQINLANLLSYYPYEGDIEWLIKNGEIKLESNLHDYLQKLLKDTKEVYLRQLFKDQIKDVNSLNILEMLELERLYYKSLNEKCYQTKIINIDDYNWITDLSEETTVTKMERRIFNLDIEKLKNNIRINDPYALYLNFFEQLSNKFAGESYYLNDESLALNDLNHFGEWGWGYEEMYLERYLEWLENVTEKEIYALGTGERNRERIIKERFKR